MNIKNLINHLERSRKVFLFACFTLITFISFAQNDSISVAEALSGKLISFSSEPLVTDRPDATEASSTVGKGVLQIETGGLFESFEDNNLKSEAYTYNTTLIRYGILDNMELRVGWDFTEGIIKINDKKLDNVASGFSPLLLGVKIDIAEENGVTPEIALIGHVSPIFTAGQDYHPETTAVDFRFSLSHTLSEKSSLAYNLGAQWEGDSSEAAAIYAVSYGYSISDQFGFYAELYGDLPEDSKATHYWDAGFTYLLNNDLQFDIYAGTSITKGQDILLGLGLSYRLLK